MGIIQNKKRENKWEDTAAALKHPRMHLFTSTTHRIPHLHTTTSMVRTTLEVEMSVLVPSSVSKTLSLLRFHHTHLFTQAPMHQLPMHQRPTLHQPTHQAPQPIMLRQ